MYLKLLSWQTKKKAVLEYIELLTNINYEVTLYVSC